MIKNAEIYNKFFKIRSRFVKKFAYNKFQKKSDKLNSMEKSP